MRHVKTFAAVACATLMFAAAADAQTPTLRRTTHLTFSTPVELPGVTLPAGTYTFELAESTSDRHILRVLDRDGQKLHTTILAIPVRRVNTTEETVVTFHELPAEATPAVRFWYYPNDIMGQELAYPKEQALRIAAASRQPVLAMEGEVASAEITRVEPDVAAADTQAAVTREREQVDVDTRAQADTRVDTDMQATGTTGRADTMTRRERLPRTASQLPLVGLLGLLALGGAAAARAYRLSRT